MITKTVRDMIRTAPGLIVTVGLLPGDDGADLAPPGDGAVVDLDAATGPVGETPNGVLAVFARTATDLRRAVSAGALLPGADRIVVGVLRAPDQAGPALPALPAEWRTLREFHAQRGDSGDWAVRARFRGAVPAGVFLAALVRGLDGGRPQAWPGVRAALAGPGAAHWRPGDPSAAPAGVDGPVPDVGQVPAADVVLRTIGADTAAWPDPRVPAVDRSEAGTLTWAALSAPGGHDGVRTAVQRLDGPGAIPPVDERSVNPVGFLSAPAHGERPLVQTGDRWSVEAGPGEVVRFHPSGAVTDADVARLRHVRAVRVEHGRHSGPDAAVRVLAGLAAAGVPLVASRLPGWTLPLGAELTRLLTDGTALDLTDDLVREEHSIRLRRAALRSHSTSARWRAFAHAAGTPAPARSPVSVLLCTRRPDFLAFAFAQIARQRDVDIEVLLVLHGLSAADPRVVAAVTGHDGPVTLVEASADLPFGAALNLGAVRATGRYLLKWDDDDWYGPDFVADLLLAAHYANADVTGCFAQFIYLEEIDLTVYRPAGPSERMSGTISGATLLTERSFFDAVGGFAPVPRSVDAVFLRAATAAGGRVYRTHGLGFLVNRRARGHTWGVSPTYFLRTATRQWRGFRPNPLMESPARVSPGPLPMRTT
ncbi:glycosyltransferase family 2 protein [Actinomadura flavalba]|uniref:glycosyltransferase family 2 protein n=1 Tax=Actinomadura flavalba TaxID=1120938 RepID=UPI00036FECF9|nr:glycosyltransferase [Actinomadura flavalba]